MTDPAAYVRDIEAYLCRKNGGHLIRVVGPAFELVRGWAEQGVPLKVACRGIDRCCERHDARGARRRPLRIEFCEADVLSAFDEWRRAVGVAAGGEDASRPRKPALSAHIERVIARLAHVRGPRAASTPLDRALDQTIRELEGAAAAAFRARGDARARIVARLDELDAALMAVAEEGLDRGLAARLQQEAADELASFGARMPPEARARAAGAAFRRLVRERCGLPTLTYE